MYRLILSILTPLFFNNTVIIIQIHILGIFKCIVYLDYIFKNFEFFKPTVKKIMVSGGKFSKYLYVHNVHIASLHFHFV